MASRRTELQKWRYPGGSSFVAFRESKPAFKKKPASGGIVPRGLYNLIQVALASRKEWETKRDKPSEIKLMRDENKVNTMANIHKLISHRLPSTWKYNPVTANTLVPSDDEPLAPTRIRFDEEDVEGGCKDDRSHYHYAPHPSEVSPNIYGVPLKEDETESWLQFKKLVDAGNLTPVPGCKPWEICETWFAVNIEHPFVSVIGSFAVNGFNESFEMFVEKNKHNQLCDPAFRECKFFYPGGDSYFFDITIEAVEDGFCGIYEARVKCILGKKLTLLEFFFTGKNVEGATKSRSSKVCIPLPTYTGMVRRGFYKGVFITSGGYDYLNPSEMVVS